MSGPVTRLWSGMALGAAVAFNSVAVAQTASPSPSSDAVAEVTVTARKNQPARAGGPDGPMTANGLLDPPAEAPKSRSCEALILTEPGALDMLLRVAEVDVSAMPRIYQPTRAPRNPDYAAAIAPDGKPVVEAAPFWKPRTINLQNMTPTDTAAMACRGMHLRGEMRLPGEPLGAASLEALSRSEIAGRDTTLPTALALFDEGRYQQSLAYFEKAFEKLPGGDGGNEAGLYIAKLNLFAPIAGADRARGLKMLERVATAPFNPTLDMPRFDPLEPERNTAIGEAAMILAQLYLDGGAGVEKDPAKALKWLERANDVGHVRAAKLAGDMYFSGIGAARDLKKAASLYREAARLDYAPAQFAYAQMLDRGDLGKPDLKQALAWYDHAAKYDHPGALFALGAAYEAGEGVPADPGKALTYYQKAALNGHAAAARVMANHLYRGEGVSKDLTAARKLFEVAAVQGDAEAMYSLGAMMARGEGGETDRVKGWVWLKLADAGKVEATPAAIHALEGRMSAEERKTAQQILRPSAS